jgi:hypothetical protein
MAILTHQTRWSSAGFVFPVRLIGVVFEPSKNLKKPLKTDNQSFERL